jgi:hypothetical protein
MQQSGSGSLRPLTRNCSVQVQPRIRQGFPQPEAPGGVLQRFPRLAWQQLVCRLLGPAQCAGGPPREVVAGRRLGG